MYQRNNRDRTKGGVNKDDTRFMRDLLDSIHCYFIHWIDVGIRCVERNVNNPKLVASETEEKKKEENTKYFDGEIRNLRSRLSKQTKALLELRGSQRIKQTKLPKICDNNS